MFIITPELWDSIQQVADQRFEGNRLFAIRWMLHQAELKGTVTSGLLVAERALEEEDRARTLTIELTQ